MRKKSSAATLNAARQVDVAQLHVHHPRLRASDWRSPLIRRLLLSDVYQDGSRLMHDLHVPNEQPKKVKGSLHLHWTGLEDDFHKCINSYQDPVLTEFATLGVACILIHERIQLEITEVTRRGEKVDYWLGDKEFVLEVSGMQSGNLDSLQAEKANQLRANPFEKSGYVCVARYEDCSTRLCFTSYS